LYQGGWLLTGFYGERRGCTVQWYGLKSATVAPEYNESARE